MNDDIMGGGEQPFDVSDEALEERGWSVEPNAGEVEPEPQDDAADIDEVEDDADANETVAAPEATDDSAPAADAEETDEWVMPEKFAGKTPEEIARAYTEYVSMNDRQAADLRKTVEGLTAAQQQQAADLAAWQAAQSEPVIDTDAALSGLDPVQSYNMALQLLDGGAADPSLVNRVIAETQEISPELAREMERDFDRRLVTAEANQRIAAVQQQYQQQLAPIQQRTFEQVASEASARFLQSDPDAEAYKADIGAIVKENPNLLGDRTPAAIERGLNQALVQARGADVTRSAAFRAQLAAEKSGAQVEQGSGQRAPRLSESDQIRQDMLKRADPADALFA